MKLVVKTLALATMAAASLFAAQRAEAQVAVDVDITVGSITILYYHNNINVNIPDTVLASLFTPVGCDPGVSCVVAPPAPTNASTPGAGSLTWVGAVDGTPAPTNISAIDLNLSNVWAVRALGGSSSNTTVTIAGGATTIAGTSGSIAVSATRGIATGATATCGGGTAATFADPGLGVAQQGSVCIRLDFTGAVAGPFNGTGDTTDSVYTLQVTGT